MRRRARAAALLAEADRLAALAELLGARPLPGHERMVLLAGRLLREGVLQQSALSAHDALLLAGEGRGPARLALDVFDACDRAVTRGVAATTIEEVDLTAALRVREDAGPDDVATVRACRGRHRGDAGGAGMSTDQTVPRIAVELLGRRVPAGPLLVVRGVDATSAGTSSPRSTVEGEPERHGLVLEVDGDLAVVQVLEGTDGHGAGPARRALRGPAAARPGRAGLAGPGVQRPRRAAGRRPAGPRRPGGPVAGWPMNPVHREPPPAPGPHRRLASSTR